MNRLLKILLFFVLLFVFCMNINASCKDAELNEWAKDVEFIFEYPEKASKYSYFFSLSKDRDDIVLEAIDGSGVSTLSTYQEDIEKNAVGGYNGVEEETYTLNIKVTKGSCKGEILKTDYYTIPQYNVYIQTSYCEQYPDHELCQRFTDKTEDMNDVDFAKTMAEYDKSVKKEEPLISETIKKIIIYALCIIIPMILISIFYKRKIKRIKKSKDIDVERHPLRKSSVFILLFMLLTINVKAASSCDVSVKLVSTTTPTNTQVVTHHSAWSLSGSTTINQNIQQSAFSYGGNTYTHGSVFSSSNGSGTTDGAVGAAVDYGRGTLANFLDQSAVDKSKLQRCIMQDEGGIGTVNVEYLSTTTGTATANYGYCCISGGYTGINGTWECYKDGELCPEPCANCQKAGSECSCSFSADDNRTYNGLSGYSADGRCDILNDKVEDDCKDTEYICPEASCNEAAELKCPTYTGGSSYAPVETVVDSYTVNNVDAYCVNPDSSYASSGYQEITVDPNKCSNSNSSVDCGYANILLEAGYNNKYNGTNISVSAINIASRLWGAYTSQGGYSGVGMGSFAGINGKNECNVDGITGSYNYGSSGGVDFQTCYDMAYYSDSTNIYTGTLKYILSAEMVAASFGIGNLKLDDITEIDVSQATSMFNGITCPSVNSGIICGSGSDLKYAIALFFNTKLGNKNFKDHLNALYGSVSTLPVLISVSSDESNTSGFKLEYQEDITDNSETIQCSKLRSKANLTSTEKRMLNYCDVEIDKVIIGGVTYNITGKVKYCQKNACYIYYEEDSDNVIIADLLKDCSNPVQVHIKYIESPSNSSIKKYVPCGSAGSGSNEYQFLYAQFDSDDIKKSDPEDKDTIMDVELNCFFACEDTNIRESSKSCVVPNVKDFKKSSNKKIAYTNSNEYYSTNGDIANSVYGKHFETSLRDPSLSCIINASPSTQNNYDYTEEYGLNSDFCTLYCSDEAHYYMSEKTVVYTGLSLKYDIEYSAFKRNSNAQAISNIVVMKRNCVSEIYYTTKFKKSFATFAGKYGLSGTENINNWSELYAYVYSHDGRNELLNKMIYDLYNCNLYSDISVVPIPKDSIIRKNAKEGDKLSSDDTVLNKIIKPMYKSSNNYNFSDECELNEESLNDSSKKSCINITGTKYQGGATYANDSVMRSGLYGNEKVGEDIDSLSFTATLSSNKNTSKFSDVRYCTGSGCYNYSSYRKNDADENMSSGEYLSPKGRYEKGDINISSEGDSQTTKIAYISSQSISSAKTTKDIVVPTNDYAYFDISTEVDYYLDSRFQTEPYTGYIYDITSRKSDRDSENLLRNTVDEYTYPVNRNSGDCAATDGSSTSNRYFSCKVDTQYGTTYTYKRNFQNKLNDPLYKKMNDSSSTLFSCYYVTKDVNDIDLVYRNVDVKDIFPTISRSTGSNWSTSTAQKVVNDTENYVKNNNEYLYYESHLEYSYTLDQEAIKKIREYNQNKGTFADDSINDSTCTASGNKYFNCKTSFIDKIENSDNDLGIVNERTGKTRGVSEYTESLKGKGE